MSSAVNVLHALIAAVPLAAVLLPGAAHAHSKPSSDTFRVVSVVVLDASTVDVAFSHELARGATDVSRRHFYGDHLGHDVPHTPRSL
jgi:hypothetical protein